MKHRIIALLTAALLSLGVVACEGGTATEDDMTGDPGTTEPGTMDDGTGTMDDGTGDL